MDRSLAGYSPWGHEGQDNIQSDLAHSTGSNGENGSRPFSREVALGRHLQGWPWFAGHPAALSFDHPSHSTACVVLLSLLDHWD